MYKIDADQQRRIADYAEFLVGAIAKASGQAIDRLEECAARLGHGAL